MSTHVVQVNTKTRQPVVVVMGHVDHGKTTLLDYVRKTSLAEREVGGITQAIGAYEAEHQGKRITFIDTPGHEAFAKMRSRGASAADVAILVVAADEGLKPQTKEAIDILNATKTPFVIAINKIDKPGADTDKVKNEFIATGVFLEGYGGKVSCELISAKTGEGVAELLDIVLLTAELEHLSYDPEASPEGYILETKMTHTRGSEVAVIVKNGILRRGDEIATASAKGKIKILENFLGQAVNEIPAGAPALVLGFEYLPKAGEEFRARDLDGVTIEAKRLGPVGLLEGDEDALKLVLKASDAGSLEALRYVFGNISPKNSVKIINYGVGDIAEGDVKSAIPTGALVIGFKTRVDKAAKSLAQGQKINVITSDVIYDLVRAVETALKEGERAAIGEFTVLAVFNSEKLDKQIVGGRVDKGVFRNRANFEVLRSSVASADGTVNGKNGGIVGMGKIINLQSEKKDANQVSEGREAGVLVNSEIEIAVGDKLVIYE